MYFLIWFIKSEFSEKDNLHTLQKYGLSPLIILILVVKTLFCENDDPHTLWFVFSYVLLKKSSVKKIIHIDHKNVFFLCEFVYVSLKFQLNENGDPHSSEEYGFSPVWVRK